MTTWKPSPAGATMLIGLSGAIELAVTDQRDRHYGWVYHVSVDGDYERAQIKVEGGFQSMEHAQGGAEAWLIALANSIIADLSSDGVSEDGK